jgi:hypothetical protein
VRIDAIDVYWMKLPLAFVFPSSYFYANDLGKPEIVLSGRGEVATSRVPGIAQVPDPDLLPGWTAAHVAFRAASS